MAARRLALRRRATAAERWLWQALRQRRCGGWRFRRQHSVGGFVLDFYCPEARIGVEVDGGVHRRPEVHARDLARSRWLADHGVALLRVDNEAVFHDVQAVAAWIAGRMGPREGKGPCGRAPAGRAG